MKYITLTFVFILFFSCQKNKDEFIKATLIPSKIDSLHTEAEIQQFIRVTDTNYKKFKLSKIADLKRNYGGFIQEDSLTKILAKQLRIDKTYLKADFDNNGFTDLIAVGNDDRGYDFSVFAIMNFGKDSLVFKNLATKSGNPSFVPAIKTVNGQELLSINYPRKMEKHSYDNISAVLTYKFGSFVEYAEQQQKHSIEKIEFITGPCFGSCPIFKLEITSDRKANLWAEENNYDRFHFNNVEEFKKRKEVKGTYNVMITKDKYQEMIDLLTYIDFKNLQDSYHANGSCQASSFLKITYDNGKVKAIGDYGINGTYGLANLYRKLYLLRFNQNWHQQSKQAKVKFF